MPGSNEKTDLAWSVRRGKKGRPTTATDMSDTYQVLATLDAESGVWVASSDDVPGLATEAESLEALEFKLQTMVPELLEINGCLQSNAGIRIQLISKRIRE